MQETQHGAASESEVRFLGPTRRTFAQKVAHWFLYRARLRAPRALAWLSGELPLRTVPLETVARVHAEGVIPHVVHQTWVDGRFGRRHARALQAMRTLNPEYTFRISTDSEIDTYMRTVWGQHPIADVYARAHYGPLKTDIWRYCTLFSEGGVYLDIGRGVAVPLRSLIDAEAGGMISYEGRSRIDPVDDPHSAAKMLEPGGVIANWLMAFRPNHPVLGEVIDAIVRDYPAFRGTTSQSPKSDILRLTGPLQLTKAFVTVLAAGAAIATGADDVRQLPFDFDGTAIWELTGSWVRYATRAPYLLARDSSIVD